VPAARLRFGGVSALTALPPPPDKLASGQTSLLESAGIARDAA
jgi:hypothetical protein